uniref:Uncharacterized protein n=1 Tax=Ixodes ricinus TaxID=34613 RepID=A0A147BM40_IXORI
MPLLLSHSSTFSHLSTLLAILILIQCRITSTLAFTSLMTFLGKPALLQSFPTHTALLVFCAVIFVSRPHL